MENASPSGACGAGLAFLFTQIGTLAAQRFGRRVAAIDLTPPDAGLLRQIAVSPGVSQQELAQRLGVVPSRMVALVDSLQGRGLVERKPSAEDRRAHALHLTAQGRSKMTALAEIAAEHEREFCAPLAPEDRSRLTDLCTRLAAAHGLAPGIHPGFRELGGDR